MIIINPHPAFVLFVNQITDFERKMCVSTSGFEKDRSQIKQIGVILTHLQLWVTVVRHNFKWVNFF